MNKNKQLFVQWLAFPKAFREPKTQKELALQLNVQPETLSRWKADPALQDQVYQVTRAYLSAELPDILHVVLKQALGGDIKFIQLVLELTGKHTDSITVKSDVPQVGIEKYSSIIKQVSKWQEERFGNSSSTHEEL